MTPILLVRKIEVLKILDLYMKDILNQLYTYEVTYCDITTIITISLLLGLFTAAQ